MAFVKILKNKAYFSRRQVRFARRRSGKTDYQARRRLTVQDCNKYSSPKYRLVVRRTNTRIIAQIISATSKGDLVHCSADSQELPKFGLSFGLTNYAAAYCTGLLCARRHLKNIGLDSAFTGQTEIDGEHFNQDVADERRPFKCVLDIGLVGTTTGNRVFAVMKGAADGGLNVPHCKKGKNKCFPGFYKGGEGEEDSFDATVLKSRIFGEHVAEYMTKLAEEDESAYSRQFGRFIKLNINPESIPEIYKGVHAKIRADPSRTKAERKHSPVSEREGDMIRTSTGKYPRPAKLNNAQRKERVQSKIHALLEAQQL